MHAALLVHQRLQQPQFGFCQNRSRCRSECAHAFSRSLRPSFISCPIGPAAVLLAAVKINARMLPVLPPWPFLLLPWRSLFPRFHSLAAGSTEPAVWSCRAARSDVLEPFPTR